MSRTQDYFPPKGTTWQWGHKALNHSPWHCNLTRQKEPDLHPFPLAAHLSVSLQDDGLYLWIVDMSDFRYQRTTKQGICKTALEACLEAEHTGEAYLTAMLPDWVRTALTNGWRPPSPSPY